MAAAPGGLLQVCFDWMACGTFILSSSHHLTTVSLFSLHHPLLAAVTWFCLLLWAFLSCSWKEAEHTESRSHYSTGNTITAVVLKKCPAAGRLHPVSPHSFQSTKTTAT